MWNENLGLLEPPVDAVAPAQFSFWCAVVYASIAAVAILFSLKHWRDTKLRSCC